MGVTPWAFNIIEWYVADAVHVKQPQEHFRSSGGAWIVPFDIILDEDNLNREEVVKHELVHLLLQKFNHNHRGFLDCAGI